MSEMERAIFAAAYAVELGKRMDVAVLDDQAAADRAIAFAHVAVALYRLRKTESDP